MKKSIIYFAALFFIVMSSCNQQPKGPTSEEILEMIEGAKATAKAEAKAEYTQLIKKAREEAKAEAKAEYESKSNSSSNHNAETSSISSLNIDCAYNCGYKDGMLFHTSDLSFFLEDNEKHLKDSYMRKCRSYDELGEENYNNKTLYNKYKMGFMKGYKDGNNALN